MVLLAGQPVRVSCFVPWDDANHLIRFGIEGVSVVITEVDRRQYTRIFERMECGTWTVSCVVINQSGVMQTRTTEITAKGLCNDGGS